MVTRGRRWMVARGRRSQWSYGMSIGRAFSILNIILYNIRIGTLREPHGYTPHPSWLRDILNLRWSHGNSSQFNVVKEEHHCMLNKKPMEQERDEPKLASKSDKVTIGKKVIQEEEPEEIFPRDWLSAEDDVELVHLPHCGHHQQREETVISKRFTHHYDQTNGGIGGHKEGDLSGCLYGHGNPMIHQLLEVGDELEEVEVELSQQNGSHQSKEESWQDSCDVQPFAHPLYPVVVVSPLNHILHIGRVMSLWKEVLEAGNDHHLVAKEQLG